MSGWGQRLGETISELRGCVDIFNVELPELAERVAQILEWRINMLDLVFVCLFVCLFHGVPEVRGGRRLTKDGPYATRRQAEAVLFVRRKPTPPFAGCQGNLLFRGSRGLQTGRPVDHRPYSARHVGLLVGNFWEQQTPVLLSTPIGRHIKFTRYS